MNNETGSRPAAANYVCAPHLFFSIFVSPVPRNNPWQVMTAVVDFILMRRHLPELIISVCVERLFVR